MDYSEKILKCLIIKDEWKAPFLHRKRKDEYKDKIITRDWQKVYDFIDEYGH